LKLGEIKAAYITAADAADSMDAVVSAYTTAENAARALLS
jgi:hypothetical protein